jgi:hypothetical protein
MSPSASGQKLAVVLSDVHIHSNSRTKWYQKNVHEGYLKAPIDE